jgi:hypothetical protein
MHTIDDTGGLDTVPETQLLDFPVNFCGGPPPAALTACEFNRTSGLSHAASSRTGWLTQWTAASTVRCGRVPCNSQLNAALQPRASLRTHSNGRPLQLTSNAASPVPRHRSRVATRADAGRARCGAARVWRAHRRAAGAI